MQCMQCLPFLHHCPYCQQKLIEGITTPDKKSEPKPGDVLVCGHCGNISVLGLQSRPHQATKEEIMNLPAETRKELFLAVRIVNSRIRKQPVGDNLVGQKSPEATIPATDGRRPDD